MFSCILLNSCVCKRELKIKDEIELYETRFSRLRTQGPQTPGKLHEMGTIKLIPKQSIMSHTTCTSVIPKKGTWTSVSFSKCRSTLIQRKQKGNDVKEPNKKATSAKQVCIAMMLFDGKKH